jgi:hypothetical protein
MRRTWSHTLGRRYGITDLSNVLCDPWSVHASPVAARIIQCFMYTRLRPEGNQYAHPLDMTPIVDMDKGKVVRIDLPYKEAPVEWNKKVKITPYLPFSTALQYYSTHSCQLSQPLPCSPHRSSSSWAGLAHRRTTTTLTCKPSSPPTLPSPSTSPSLRAPPSLWRAT